MPLLVAGERREKLPDRFRLRELLGEGLVDAHRAQFTSDTATDQVWQPPLPDRSVPVSISNDRKVSSGPARRALRKTFQPKLRIVTIGWARISRLQIVPSIRLPLNCR